MSVVVSVRDGADYLAKALDSVLSQTLPQFELIVVDDGSTDGTQEILTGTEARDPRVRVLQCERSGLVAALNQGCAAAIAPYIARFDADDIALPRRLEWQMALLDAHADVGLVGGAYFVIDAVGRRRATVRPPTTDSALRARLSRYNVFAHSATTFRREAFEGVGGYRLAEAEDYDLWLRIAEHWKLASVPEPVLEYRHHPSQTSLVRAREYALSALAARVAADRRRAGARDPLDGVLKVTPEVLEQLGLSAGEVARATADIDIRRAATLAKLGDSTSAAELLDAAGGNDSPYTARQARARYRLVLAAHAGRDGRNLQAAWLIAKAVATSPGAVVAELAAALARRHPSHA